MTDALAWREDRLFSPPLSGPDTGPAPHLRRLTGGGRLVRDQVHLRKTEHRITTVFICGGRSDDRGPTLPTTSHAAFHYSK